MYPRQARFASLILVAALFVVTGMISAQCLTWSSGFGQPGLNDAALAIATYDDGTGPAIYAGGAFGRADGVNAEHLAKWNGTHWASLSTGLDGNVDALAVFDDGSGPALFAGGDFTHAGGAPANHIARWDGHEWSALGA